MFNDVFLWNNSPWGTEPTVPGVLNNSPWDIEVLCKSELTCSDKIHSYKKLFAAYFTNYTWRVKMIQVILVFFEEYYWLDKLVSIV